jgi:hypothetical protein
VSNKGVPTGKIHFAFKLTFPMGIVHDIGLGKSGGGQELLHPLLGFGSSAR